METNEFKFNQKDKKFKVWDIKKKVMTPNMPLIMLAGWLSAARAEGNDLNDYEIFEFTGLIDVKGEEIYEGDICEQVISGITIVAPASFDEGRCGFGLFALKEDFPADIGNVLVVDTPPTLLGHIRTHSALLTKKKPKSEDDGLKSL